MPDTYTVLGLVPVDTVATTESAAGLEISTTDIVLLSLFVTYAYLPDTTTATGFDPTTTVEIVVGDWIFVASITERVLLNLFVTYK